MNAVGKLTGYAKTTELLETVVTVPATLIPFARTVAGVPASDPHVLKMYPLTAPQAEAIAAKAELAVEPDRFGYCLEAIAEPERSRASITD
nr:hypothetical protein [uncultured Rhodopila sp.]